MEKMQQAQQLPFWKKIMYALGQFGWALTSYSVGNLLVYFYLSPPDKLTGESIFPQFIYQGQILGPLTLIGFIFATGRLIDAVTDPVIAGLSDRNKSSFGRRRLFLAIGALPFALLSLLAFVPPMGSGSANMINGVWVFATVIVFYWFMTIYVTPYFAWLSELGHSPDERLLLSTMISITFALGFAVGSQAYTFQSIFEGMGFESVPSFQITVAIFAALGFVFMLLPIIFIDEKKYCESHYSEEGIFEAVLTAFKDRNFLRFTLSDLAYWVSLTFIQTGIIYYVTVLLNLEKQAASQYQLALFGISFLFYIPVNITAKKFGKKSILFFGFLLFALTYVVVFMLGLIPGLTPQMQGWLMVVTAAIPLAIFGILPNAVVADIAEANGIVTGNFKAGIFFGARTFMSKMGQMIAGFIFPALIIIGAQDSNVNVTEFGVRITGLAALVFVSFGLLFLVLYKEKDILNVLATKEHLSEVELEEIQS